MHTDHEPIVQYKHKQIKSLFFLNKAIFYFSCKALGESRRVELLSFTNSERLSDCCKVWWFHCEVLVTSTIFELLKRCSAMGIKSVLAAIHLFIHKLLLRKITITFPGIVAHFTG